MEKLTSERKSGHVLFFFAVVLYVCLCIKIIKGFSNTASHDAYNIVFLIYPIPFSGYKHTPLMFAFCIQKSLFFNINKNLYVYI